MEKQSIKYFGQQNAEKNVEVIKKLLPEKSVIIHFDGNPYFKEFLSHFFTETNLQFVQELVHKLAEFRVVENDSNAHADVYNDRNFFIKRSYFISAIVSYSRIFNSPKSKIKKLDIKHLVKEIPQDLMLDEVSMRNRLLKIHEKVITLRNKYIAHAEDAHFETISAFMKFQFNEKILEYSLQGVYLGTYNFDEEEIQDWIMLNSFLIKKLKGKQEELMNLFFNNLAREELFKLAAEAGAFSKD